MKRLLVLLVVVVAVVAVAAFRIPSDAATVNGTGISQSTLNADLTAIGRSTGYQCLLNAQVAVQTNGQSPAIIVYGSGAARPTPRASPWGSPTGGSRSSSATSSSPSWPLTATWRSARPTWPRPGPTSPRR